MLAVEEVGHGEPLVLVHGFTQTGRSWGPVAGALGRRRRLVLVDAPGHGRSAAERLDLWEAGKALARTARDAAGGPADVVGYSMGGRLCLHAALVEPAAVRRLVLVGATAGIADPAARRARRADDLALADALEREGDAGLPAFLDRWLDGPLFARLPREAAAVETRLENTAAGLAAALRLLGTGAQEALDGRLGAVAVPVLIVVGEHDAKFRAEADRLAGALPRSEVAVVPGAGHACHLEAPEAFAGLVERWLTATPPA